MSRLILAACLAVAMGGCVPADGFTPNTFEARQAAANAAWSRDMIRAGRRAPLTEAQVRDLMRDPDSVRFRHVVRSPDTGAVCGLINARNGFGGFTGETPFIYFHSQSQRVPQLFTGSRVMSLTVAYIEAHCAG
jgi:hypothetical protein